MRIPVPFVFAALFLLLSSGTVLAQSNPPATDRYAAESFVITHNDWVYANSADGTGYREHTVAVKMQSDAALREFGVIAIGFASASEHVEIHYARVRHADGSVTETPVSGAMEQPDEVTRQAPFYSDLKQEQLPVKNMGVGDTLEWQARIVRTRAEAPGQFWGQESFASEDSVTLEQSIELRVPAASAATVWTNPKLGLKPVESTEGETKIYHWTYAQLAPTAGPAAEAAKKAKKTKLLTAEEEEDAEYGKLPSIAWTSFKSWEDVGAWYRRLEGERAVPDDEIKAKVSELTAGKTSEEDKVRAVYAYVSSQIRYIGVAFGVGRYQPHEAADVLHNQYGDCKDKATLLSAMLAVLGLHADSVLIGYQIHLNEAVPSPAAFNHLITRVQTGGKQVWLDATQEVAPYEVLLLPLRDRPALVIPEQGAAMLVHTPANLPFPAEDRWKAVGKIDKDGISDAHIVMTLRGDDEVAVRAVVHQIPPARYDDLTQRMLASFGYQGTASHSDLSRPEETSSPFSMAFDYHREKPGRWSDLQIVPQLSPIALPAVDEKDPPVGSIELGPPRTEIETAEMKLPDGWTAELPEAIHEKTAFATFDLTYKFDKGTVYAERKIVVLQRKVPASDWKTYKKWCDAIDLGFEKFIQLRRGPASKIVEVPVVSGKKGAPSGGAPAEVTVTNSEDTSKASTADSSKTDESTANDSPETLIEKAMVALQVKDDQNSERLLKAAETKNPKAKKLWAAYSMLAMMRGMPYEAITDAHKELERYPDETQLYAMIAASQEQQRDTPGALETLHQWAAVDSEDPKPQEMMSSLLMNSKQYPEAAEAAAKALKLLGGNAENTENLKLTLGTSLLKSGKLKEGEATLTALLGESPDPGMTNNIVYELADAKLQLPLDEEKQKWALERLSAETRSWTLDESPQTLRAKSSLLVAAWDTMGWIFYREGKFDEAKSYIEAAWWNGMRPDMKEHMEQVYAALGIKDSGKEFKDLQKARIVPLGNAEGKNGVAEYRLLISSGQVERAVPVGEKSVTDGEAILKKASMAKYFPAGANAKLMCVGMLNCHGGKCELVMEP